MKIRNKLYLINTIVFLLFSLIFIYFIFSSFKLLALKDLQRNASSVRNSILAVEYANRSVLNSNEAPILTLKWSGEDAANKLENFSKDKNLNYLDAETVKRIKKIYDDFLNQNFEQYMLDVSAKVFEIRPKIYGTSLNKKLVNIAISTERDEELYLSIEAISRMIHDYILRHRPLTEAYLTISTDITLEVQSQVKQVMNQTIFTMTIGIFISILIVFLIYRNMIGKLQHVKKGIQKISSGDLLTRINVNTKDELATIGINFNLLTETIWQKLNNIGSIIHDMGQSLEEEDTGLSLEQSILDLAIENTQADSGAFYLPDYDTKKVKCLLKSKGYALPFENDSFSEELPFGQTIIGMAVLSGESLFLKNLESQNLIPKKNIFDKGYISSCLILPLVTDNVVRALLCLEKNSEKKFFSDMDYENIQSFIEFSAITLNNLSQYTKLIEGSGLNREMEIASDIQKSLLPPRLPRISNFELTVKTFTLKGISGDIYDFFLLGKNRWLFCLAEVEEKGIASSMLLVILRTLVRILVKVDQDPGEMLTQILNNFQETTGIKTALKINLCLMDPDKKTFHYCGTQGQKLLLFDKQSQKTKLITAQQKENNRFVSVKGTLRKDVFLLMMTDGFYAVKNEYNEEYGWESVQDILQKYSDKGLTWLQDAMNKDLSYFERHLEQRDDRTIFIARFTGAEG